MIPDQASLRLTDNSGQLVDRRSRDTPHTFEVLQKGLLRSGPYPFYGG